MKAKVLYAGPDVRCIGGIASVLQSYSRVVPDFTYIATNSPRGTIPGLFTFAAAIATLPVYRMRGFNILHAHGACGKSFIRKRFLLNWARILGFRTIFHSHGGGFKEYAGKAGRERIAAQLRRFSAIAVLTDSWRQYFTDTLGCRNVQVIPNIIEPPKEPVARKCKEDASPLHFLFMGKICRNKGVYDMLEAVAMHHSDFKGRMTLTICGNGESEELKKKIRELGIDDVVSYGGIITPDMRDTTYRSADVFLLPSYVEGLPITILEAAAYCVPSIASTVGAIPTIVKSGQNGLLIEAGDTRSLAEAMLVYINNHEAVFNHGQAARLAINNNLPEAVLAALGKLYSMK